MSDSTVALANDYSETDAPAKLPIEYIVVADRSSKVILSTDDYNHAVRTANLIRSANGEVTIFRSLKS